MDTEEGTVATQETETATPEISPTGAVPPDATPEGAAGAEVTPAGPKEGEPPAPEETPLPWATTSDPYEVIEHEAFRPVLERRDNDIYKRALGESRTEVEKSFVRADADAIHKSIDGHLGTALERLRDDDSDAAGRAYSRIEEIQDRYGPVKVEAEKVKAVGQAYGDAADFFRQSVLTQGMSLKQKHEFEDFAKTQASWEPVLKKRDELLRPAIEAEVERMRESRETKEERAARLALTKPPVKPEGGGGGGLPMTYEAYMARTPEQDAAISDADHRRMFEEGVRRQGAATT